ncbi:MAG TPA: PEGA domain-containing protein [Kofleriaceae bacterium]
MLKALSIACAVVCGLRGVAAADRTVAVAPLEGLGDDSQAGTKQVTQQIEQAVAALPGTRVVGAAEVADAIKKAKKSQLKACEGDAGCRADIGKLVGADLVISGEVGGLGDAKVVYLGALDVASGKELRSTTLAVGGKEADVTGGAPGAIVRLLDPDHYRGTLHFTLDVTGATVYVNGTRVGLSPRGELALPVGAQAVRVTHPQYRDFVRFIDVPYGKTTEVTVGMQQYPIVEHDLAGKPTSRDHIVTIDPPWYRRWYVIVPVAIVVAAGTAVAVGYASHDFASSNCRLVSGAGC